MEFRRRMNFIILSFWVWVTVNDFGSGFVMFIQSKIYTMKTDGNKKKIDRFKVYKLFNDTFLLLYERILGLNLTFK